MTSEPSLIKIIGWAPPRDVSTPYILVGSTKYMSLTGMCGTERVRLGSAIFDMKYKYDTTR